MQLVRITRHLLLFVLYALIGALLAGVVVFVWLGVSGKPDLKPWHTAALHADFTRANSARVNTLDAYRKLEDRLFEELRTEVYQRVAPEDQGALNRYSAGSRADPTALSENFNQTFELETDAPRAGVILIHGLTAPAEHAPHRVDSSGCGPICSPWRVPRQSWPRRSRSEENRRHAPPEGLRHAPGSHRFPNRAVLQ
jgi:hypothetical protein